MDPGAAMGFGVFGGATPQTGTMTFYFYAQAGGVIASYTTSGSSPGDGLNSAGALPPGGTYSVLLSQLLKAAGGPSSFNGYVFIITQFTNGHGQYFITNFSGGFTSGAQLLVLSGPRYYVPEELVH